MGREMEDPTHASALAQAPAAEKAVVLTRTVIEPDTEALLEAPLKIEIEVRASKAITNARWEATYLADFANAKQTGKRKEGSAQVAETGVTLVEGQSHTFSFAVSDFVNELCEGIVEETLLNVGVIYITLYSGETEVERFPFVTHVRRRRVEGRKLWRYVFDPLAPSVES